MSRPIALIDIDGVIVLLGPGQEETFEATVAGFPVTIAVAARERVQRIATVFDLVWASSWEHDGADQLGPLLGLEDRPFLSFQRDLHRRAASHKLPAVKRFIRDRPMAWVGDELSDDVVAWAAQRKHPTLLVPTDPRIGLTDEQTDELVRFAARVFAGESRGNSPEALRKPR